MKKCKPATACIILKKQNKKSNALEWQAQITKRHTQSTFGRQEKILGSVYVHS
jgi:hypothetical protein